MTVNSVAKTAKIIALFCKVLSGPVMSFSTATSFNLSQRKNIRRKTNAPAARKIIAAQSVICVCLEIEFAVAGASSQTAPVRITVKTICAETIIAVAR